MPRAQDQITTGPIEGLRLPMYVWSAFQTLGIRTMPELRAELERLEKLPGIGRRAAMVIREEVARYGAGTEQRNIHPS